MYGYSIDYKKFLNPILLWIISTTIVIYQCKNIYVVVPICIGTILCTIDSIINFKKNKIIIYTTYVLLILLYKLKITDENLFLHYSIYYSPAIIYCNIKDGVFNQTNIIICALSSIALLFIMDNYLLFVMLISINIISMIYSVNALQLENISNKYYKYYSSSKDEKLELHKKYIEQIQNENHKIEIAILNERNRISRDIHDSLGHLTSRGILQIGAMLVNEKDEDKIRQLNMLKNTLSEGMNEVRKSLHNFQNESINLEEEINKIIKEFTFYKVNFTYSLSKNINLKYKYSIIYIVKEALTNVSKHSNATIVDISMVEMSDNIYINIKDNGSNSKIKNFGMGLNSIRKRINEINGTVEIFTENGFRIFITICKEN